MEKTLTIGVVQFKPARGEVDKNLQETDRLLASAGGKQCDVVVLPEMWPTGMYGDLDFHKFKEPIPGRYTDFLSNYSRRYGFHIIAGMPERGVANQIHNAAVLIDRRGNVIAKHRKVHPYTFLGEQKVWTPGDSFTVVDTDMGRVGLLVCYDGDFPESWRANALMGAEIVFDICYYESPCESWWQKFYPAAALQNVLWAVLCNSVGDSVVAGKPLHAFGQSRIIGPDGEVEAEAPYVKLGAESESYLLVKTIEMKSRFQEARQAFGNFLMDRRPEVYHALTTRQRE